MANKITADRFNALKAEVKAECQRRAYAGEATSSSNMATYASADYDYINIPAAGVKITAEHRDKNAIPLNKINSTQVPNASGIMNITDEDLTALEAFTTVLKARVYSDKGGTDCSGGCTGMCYGCQDTCTGSCTGTCTGGCSSCSGSCTGSCSGGCSGCEWCSYTCGGHCASSCWVAGAMG